jgi:hypothetical protein
MVGTKTSFDVRSVVTWLRGSHVSRTIHSMNRSLNDRSIRCFRRG